MSLKCQSTRSLTGSRCPGMPGTLCFSLTPPAPNHGVSCAASEPRSVKLPLVAEENQGSYDKWKEGPLGGVPSSLRLRWNPRLEPQPPSSKVRKIPSRKTDSSPSPTFNFQLVPSRSSASCQLGRGPNEDFPSPPKLKAANVRYPHR